MIIGTASANVVDGRITVEVPDATDTDIHQGPDGTALFLDADVEPWGAEEPGMKRADTKLADMGWRRTGHWQESGALWCCPVAAATMIQLTREIAQALAEADRVIGHPGTVEAWTARFGVANIAAMDDAGLVRRQEHWTGCLELTELGERLGARLAELGHGYAAVGRGPATLTASELVSEQEWRDIQATLVHEFAATVSL